MKEYNDNYLRYKETSDPCGFFQDWLLPYLREILCLISVSQACKYKHKISVLQKKKKIQDKYLYSLIKSEYVSVSLC